MSRVTSGPLEEDVKCDCNTLINRGILNHSNSTKQIETTFPPLTGRNNDCENSYWLSYDIDEKIKYDRIQNAL